MLPVMASNTYAIIAANFPRSKYIYWCTFAVIDGDEIVYRDYYDVSIAVATPKGLVVPVLRNVEAMNFAGCEKVSACPASGVVFV